MEFLFLMSTLIIAAQITGISAAVLTIVSMQFRSNRTLFICQEISGFMLSAAFFMLGAWAGALMELFGAIRPAILLRENIAKSKYTLGGLLIFLLICSAIAVFIFGEKWYLITIVAAAQTAGTVCMWLGNGKIIRAGQLLAVSPLWIVYNLLLPVPSIGGILTEAICIVSCITALYRYRKIGFTER